MPRLGPTERTLMPLSVRSIRLCREAVTVLADADANPRQFEDGERLTARYGACRERRRVPLPDPPLPVTLSPDIRHDEDAASVHPANCRLHLRPMQDRSDAAIHINQLHLKVIRVHHVVGQRRQPAISWHNGRARLDEHKGKVRVEHVCSCLTVALCDASLELSHGQFQISAHGVIVARAPRPRAPELVEMTTRRRGHGARQRDMCHPTTSTGHAAIRAVAVPPEDPLAAWRGSVDR
jgi:hypothetical protein